MPIIPQPTSEQARLQILYMLDRLAIEIETDQFWCAFMEMDLLPYVDFMGYLDELSRNGMIAKNDFKTASYYSITRKGQGILAEFRQELGTSVCRKIDDYCAAHKKQIMAEQELVGNFRRVAHMQYEVCLRMLDRHDTVFEMHLVLQSRNAAVQAIRRWRENAFDIYGYVFDHLR